MKSKKNTKKSSKNRKLSNFTKRNLKKNSHSRKSKKYNGSGGKYENYPNINAEIYGVQPNQNIDPMKYVLEDEMVKYIYGLNNFKKQINFNKPIKRNLPGVELRKIKNIIKICLGEKYKLTIIEHISDSNFMYKLLLYIYKLLELNTKRPDILVRLDISSDDIKNNLFYYELTYSVLVIISKKRINSIPEINEILNEFTEHDKAFENNLKNIFNLDNNNNLHNDVFMHQRNRNEQEIQQRQQRNAFNELNQTEYYNINMNGPVPDE